MSVSKEDIVRLNADYTMLTQKPVVRFVCPITLDDDPNAELMDGHVLNEGIKHASRATVIQRKDVDNYFGGTIEPDLVKYLNIPVSTPNELVRNAKNLTITTPGGKKMNTFFGNNKARNRFQQINLQNPDGTLFASPFLKNDILENKLHKDLDIEWTTTVNNFAVIGSLIKSGYLALFRMLGYSWVLHADGDKVRRALAAFYQNKANKKQAINYFVEFSGSVNFIAHSGSLNDVEDTLKGGNLWLHFIEGDLRTGVLFAVTCLFRVNDQIMTVTLPCYQKEGYYFIAFDHYQAFLKNRSIRHNVYLSRYKNEQFEISPTPLRVRGTS